MRASRTLAILLIPVLAVALTGCTARNVDFSQIKQPARAPELDAYNAFVGDWNWTAEVVNAEGASKHWKGTASWQWTLDNRCLHGTMSSKTADAQFDTAGIWSWHPTRKKYIWWMFNNWGFPQAGTAKYCDNCPGCKGCWKMKYRSVGLDGTPSYGLYTMKVVDKDTLEWTMNEWVDAMHTIKKIEMVGTYKRK